MLLSEAIEFLDSVPKHPIHGLVLCQQAAVSLGLAALREIEWLRFTGMIANNRLLPGETPPEEVST